MNELFLNVLRTSLVVGGVTLVLAAAAPLWNKAFTAGWKRRLWCLLALVLIFGGFFRLPDSLPHVTFRLPQRQVLVAESGVKLIAPEATMEERYGADVTAWPREYFTPQYNAALSSAYPAVVQPLPERRVDLLALLALVWLAGAGIFLLWQALGGAVVARRVRRWGHAAENPALQAQYETICADMALSGPAPALVICPGVGSPQLRGLVRPKLLLPAEDYPAESADCILRHELTHWRCHDLPWKAAVLLANALHWFNPAVWLLRREANGDMERACDETVCADATAEDRRIYGAVLLDTLHRGRQSGLSTYFYGGKTVMKERLTNILSTKNRRRGAGAAILCLVLTVLAMSLVACTQKALPEEDAQEDTPPLGYSTLLLSLALEGEPYSLDGGMTPSTASADTMGELLTVHALAEGGEVVCYWDPSGDFKYWALRRGDTLTRFAREENAYTDQYRVTDYTDVFGHDGFRIECRRGAAYTAYDYYYLDENDLPVLLAACSNFVVEQDLNDDGEKELLWFYHGYESYYYYRRDGILYMADINALLKNARPDWQILDVMPDRMQGDLLPIRYQASPDGAPQEGAICFTPGEVVFYGNPDPGTPAADAFVTEMAQTYLRKAIAYTETCYELGDDFSEENFFSNTHITVLDSRQTGLTQVEVLPAKDGSGQIEIWSLAYQLKLKNPDKIPLAGAMTLLGDWLTVGPGGDSYNQPVFALWRGRDGACTQLDSTIEGTVGEIYLGSYNFYAAELLHRQTGLRPDQLTFEVFTDPDFTPAIYRLEQAANQWSLYIPERWVAEKTVENPPDAATSTRQCVGFWHDPADANTAVLVYHVDRGLGEAESAENLLRGAAADAGAGELSFVSQYFGNQDTSSGLVQVKSAKTTQDVILRVFTVDDGTGGAWAVVTRASRNGNEAWSEVAVCSFLAERPAAGSDAVVVGLPQNPNGPTD
ncbi:MAG: M56 family metallopeptidase [Oscillibacter sp.]